MNTTQKSSSVKSLLIISIVIMLSACSQESVKPGDTSAPPPDSMQDKSVSKSDREKYKNGITALYNDDLSKAQRIFNEFIRNKPSLAGAYSNLALIHIRRNEHDKALPLLDKAIKLNPKQAQAFNLRAQVKVNLGKIHEAKSDYLKAVELKESYANAQYNLALLYDIYLQEIELAIKHYSKYMSLLNKPDEETKEWINHLKGTLKHG